MALKTWSDGRTQLSIGKEDEIHNTKIRYLSDGIEVLVLENSDVKSIVFQVAWLTLQNPEKEAHTHGLPQTLQEKYDW